MKSYTLSPLGLVRFLPLAALFLALPASVLSQAITVSNLWSISTSAGRPYVTNATASSYTERGVAYSVLRNHAYIVSRAVAPVKIAILDGDTGAEVGFLNVAGISGGTFILSTIGVADDGAIYAANLTTGSATSPYKIYRWADESSAPTVAFSGNPSAGANNNRYGESFDVRGSGVNTEILASANGAAIAALFQTANGTTFTSTRIDVPGIGAGDLTKGISFGPTNTFYGKNNANVSVRFCLYTIIAGAGTGVVLASHTVASGIAPIDVDPVNAILAGVESANATSPHNLRVYDISGAVPAQIFITAFPAPAVNNGNIVGEVQIAGDRIFAIDAQNGVVMAKLYFATNPVPPTITQQPASQTVVYSGYTTLTVGAAGTKPLSYQWYFNSTNAIPNATNSTLNLTNLYQTNAGAYSVTVTNIAGTTNSAPANITLSPAVLSSGMAICWRIPAGTPEYPYVTTDSTQRGLAYNAVYNHVLLVSRTPNNAIHVFDAVTGAHLHTLDLTGVSGGTFPINMIACSADGQVFVGNLTTNPSDVNNGPYKLYSWADSLAGTLPQVAWSGDPDGGATTNRWGDNLDVHGSGSGVEALIGARNTKRLAILNNFGASPSITLVDVPDAENGNFGMSAIWGDADTCWGKSSGTAIRHVAFDRNAHLGTVLRTITNYPTMGAIAVDVANQLLAGVTLETPDTLRLVHLEQPLSTSLELDTEFFPTDNANANGTGEVRFGADSFGFSKLFALDSNNGIIALNIGGRLNQSRTGNMLTLTWQGERTLQASGEVFQGFTNVVGAASGYTIDVTAAGRIFFRLKD
ncbi:MAG: hypothetical protein QOF48_1420 [Verrucomicrobiota bacterium]|jgi:hypothetical protein